MCHRAYNVTAVGRCNQCGGRVTVPRPVILQGNINQNNGLDGPQALDFGH